MVACPTFRGFRVVATAKAMPLLSVPFPGRTIGAYLSKVRAVVPSCASFVHLGGSGKGAVAPGDVELESEVKN